MKNQIWVIPIQTIYYLDIPNARHVQQDSTVLFFCLQIFCENNVI